MTGAPLLTVAMIVRNEAETIAASLDSISPIADEIVIFDSSDDSTTREAASAFSVEWIEGDWVDDFSAARNACLARAAGAWVLWLDAGETIDAEDAAALRDFIDSEAINAATLYMLLIDAPPASEDSEAEQIGQLRLAPNDSRLAFQGRVRETMEPSALQAGFSVAGLPYRIHRGPREHDTQRKAARAQRNLRLVDLTIAADGPSALMYNTSAAAHFELGEVESAAMAYAKAVDMAPRGSIDMLEAYYGILSTLEAIPNSEDRQMQLCLQALEIFPVDAQLLCAIGGYLQRQQRLDLAQRSYETAFRFGQVNPSLWHVGRIQEIAGVCFSLTLQLQGNDDASLQVLREAIVQHPDSTALKRHLLNGLIRQGSRDEAIEVAETLPVEDIDSLRSVIRGACLAAEENWLAANAYLKVAYTAGNRDPLCLRWYTLTLLRQGLVDEAREVMHGWEQVEPGNVELASYRQLLGESGGAEHPLPTAAAGGLGSKPHSRTGGIPASPN